ncbi:MAG: adenylosuccinate lyase [Candidatus Dormibacteraeota bacterium]|nr:adenylosuccinate lyase [Candidatus Dormibacteraeota bacterium]
MREVWSDNRRFEHWLRIEILAAEAWAEAGRVPQEALPAIRRATFDVEKIAEVEERVGHDVIAFLTVVGESIGADSRFLHLGMTSSDVLDTALALQLRESAGLILAEFEKVRDVAVELAIRHRRTLMPGRTHGIHAEPITFGFKVAGWVAELDRALERLARTKEEISVGKLSGAVGSHASIPPGVEERVLGELGLAVDKAGTQVVSRDRHADYLATLAIAAGTLERIALEIRHLQRTEVGEAFEPFGREQKGSSAMPHKRNPVLTERICGLARVVRGYAATGLENIALWHERDISHSSAERVVLPDACALVDYMATQMHRVLAGLEVRPERMLHNLEAGGGVVYSQRVLLALVDAGMSREDAYLVVQSAAMRAMDGEGGFRANLEADKAVREKLADIASLFDPEHYLRNIDVAFDRLNLGVPK